MFVDEIPSLSRVASPAASLAGMLMGCTGEDKALETDDDDDEDYVPEAKPVPSGTEFYSDDEGRYLCYDLVSTCRTVECDYYRA